MKVSLTIALTLAIVSIYGQDVNNICNCLKTPIDCVPEVSKRKIVNSDTVPAHHYCYDIWSIDENKKSVVLTSICDRNSDVKSQTWYDTSGKFIYSVETKNNITKECFWYHYPPENKNYDYTIGFRDGELFKEFYEWDKYEASWKKKIKITAKEITTVIATDERDNYGNIIHLVSTVPNKSGKVE